MWLGMLLGWEFGVFLQELFVSLQQFLAGQTQVERDVGNGTAGFQILEFAFHDELFDEHGGRIASGQGQDFDEQVPADAKKKEMCY